ncbi:hypothetical protein GCM10007863_43820 [Dyella mobilis]|nr:hypothetical protein GCM10007863_43820 [Dyella mobilis]
MSSSVKATFTNEISGPLSQVKKPMTKNSTPMMTIGSNVDVRDASAVNVVDDMNTPRERPDAGDGV